MLQALFHSVDNVDDQGLVSVPFEILDYDITRLKRKTVGNTSCNGNENLEEKSGFYFNQRPDWVYTRWINIDRASTSTPHASECTMKKLAAKYTLHPLALEDALSPSIRPKAEVFSSHYLLIVPMFSLIKDLKLTTSIS